MTDRPLIHRDGLRYVLLLLQVSGSACPVCGFGTRVTSKRWARCRRPECGERVRRRSMDEARALIEQAIADTEHQPPTEEAAP